MRVPKDGVERFPSVVRAADALLAIIREASLGDLQGPPAGQGSGGARRGGD